MDHNFGQYDDRHNNGSCRRWWMCGMTRVDKIRNDYILGGVCE